MYKLLTGSVCFTFFILLSLLLILTTVFIHQHVLCCQSASSSSSVLLCSHFLPTAAHSTTYSEVEFEPKVIQHFIQVGTILFTMSLRVSFWLFKTCTNKHYMDTALVNYLFTSDNPFYTFSFYYFKALCALWTPPHPVCPCILASLPRVEFPWFQVM